MAGKTEILTSWTSLMMPGTVLKYPMFSLISRDCGAGPGSVVTVTEVWDFIPLLSDIILEVELDNFQQVQGHTLLRWRSGLSQLCFMGLCQSQRGKKSYSGKSHVTQTDIGHKYVLVTQRSGYTDRCDSLGSTRTTGTTLPHSCQGYLLPCNLWHTRWDIFR